MSKLEWPTLTEVAPFEMGALTTRRRLLEPDAREQLIAEFESDEGSAPKGSPAHQILASLHSRHMWLLCGCNGDHEASAPILYVQITRSSKRPLMIVRNYSRALHNPACPFSRIRKVRGHSLAARTLTTASAILGNPKAVTASAGTSKVRLGTSRSSTTPSLANVLFSVLEKAGCNRILGSSRSVTRDTEAIRNALRSFHMDNRSTIGAADYFGTNLYQFEKISERVKAASALRSWPSTLRPQGFVIGLCDIQRSQKRSWLVTPSGRNSAQERWEVTGHLRLPGPDTPGPKLAIGLIAIPSPGRNPEIVQAYAHPANSLAEFMLVDSELERQTLAILTEHSIEMKQRGKPFSVIKPYLDITGAVSGVSYRPDFVVTVGSKSVYVETMGYTDDEYCERKSRMHSAMERDHPVIPHTPGNDDDEFRARIDHFINV